MKHVYDVRYDLYSKDARTRSGYWDWNLEVSVVANGSIERAMRKAVRVIKAQVVKPERDKETGEVYCYRPHRVKITRVEQVREVSE